MKILQVVALVTSDGRYGGPSTVAMNQCAALTAQGHEVTLAALTDDPAIANGLERATGAELRLRKFRKLFGLKSFSASYSLGHLIHLLRASREHDIVHVHLARDLFTMPFAFGLLLMKRPFVVQTHGMISKKSDPFTSVFDAFLTRPVLRRARRWMTLTSFEEGQLSRVLGDGTQYDKATRVANGVDAPADWSPNAPKTKTVSFISRLQERKHPERVVQLAATMPEVRFIIAGPDEGMLPELQRLTNSLALRNLEFIGAIPFSEVQALLRKSTALLLPSEGEVFPMIVLESLSVGTPVIITSSCGLADAIESSGGVVTDGTISALESAVEHIVEHPGMREAARNKSIEEFSMKAVASKLAIIYGATA